MRLIDADALIELIANNVYPVQDAFNSRDYGMFWTGGIEKAINNAPTVDAVEVVRCKDCKWYNATEGENCVAYDAFWATEPDDYCAWGERRENEQTD